MEAKKKQQSEHIVEDPLANYWGLTLFPSISALPSSKPYNPNHDLHSIHNHLRSMALRSPTKLVEQTKSILDDNPRLFNSEDSSDPSFDVVAEEVGDFGRTRRPGLGLKRARFSLKPTTKPSVENLIPSLDINNLKDPVEFFLAHERVENAKREIQKQMGGSFEPSQENASTKPRQRRPGLRGNDQRAIKYRHRYPKETSDNNDYVPLSQETFGLDSVDPVGENTDKDGVCLPSLENEVTDSSAIDENKLNDILDGLLSCNSQDLEEDRAITFLQERLQIKPFVLEKLSVPDFPDNQVIDLKSSQGDLSKPRKPLSTIDNLLKGMKNKTPLRKDVGSPMQQLASPTPPRNPYAALSSLHKHISRSKPSEDPFSAHEVDHSSLRNSSPTCMTNSELNLVGSGKPSDVPTAHVIEDVVASKTNTVMDTDRNCSSVPENSKKDNHRKSPNKLNEPLTEDIITVSETGSIEDAARNHVNTSQKSMENNSREPVFGANIDSNENHVDMDVDIRGSGMDERAVDDTVGRLNTEANEPCQFGDKILAENIQTCTTSMPADDMNFNLVETLADQSSPARFQTNSMDKSTTKKSDAGPEQCLQEKTDNSIVPVNGQRRVKLRAQREQKRLRKSLAAAGTSWNAGVRRSTRIRTRPLEYWKGERLVYGRVHESLATVIGVKCMSPGSDGKPTMKVKSYVSDKHKELLEMASLY